MIERTMNRSKKFLIAAILALCIFGLLECLMLFLDKHKSLSFLIWKNIAYASVLEDAQKYYSIEQDDLQFDEWLLARKAWPDNKIFEEMPMKTDNPFSRLIYYPKTVEGFMMERKIHSVEDINVLVEDKGTALSNNFYVFNEPFDSYVHDPVDDVVLRSLYCDTVRYDEIDHMILQLTKDDEGGYLDTHYLFNLLLLEKGNCYDRKKIEAEKRDVINNIYEAQEEDLHFSDLYVERIVMLYWAGEGDQVQEAWIQRIKTNHMLDHGWSEFEESTSNAHTTGLAALAIRYYLDGQDKQNFLLTSR